MKCPIKTFTYFELALELLIEGRSSEKTIPVSRSPTDPFTILKLQKASYNCSETTLCSKTVKGSVGKAGI